MPYAEVRGRRLWYEQAGQGEALVLLHHATASSRNWRRQLPALRPHFQVLTYDRLGFGRSDWLESWPEDYHYQDLADLMALLDSLQIAEAALVGHSDGATIGLLAAARYPQRVRCLVAEAPHVFVEANSCPAGIEAFVSQVAHSPRLRKSLLRDHGPHAFQVVARWQRRWLAPEFWRWSVAHELPQVRCPVLVVHGAEDSFFPIAHSQLIADRVADGRLWVIPDVGHTPHAECAELFNEGVLDFLRLAG